MKWLERFKFSNRGAIMQDVAQQICSTNEGQEFARKFLYNEGNSMKGLNEKNRHFEFFEPLRIFFEFCD